MGSIGLGFNPTQFAPLTSRKGEEISPRSQEVQAMFSVLNKSPPIPETLSSEGKDFLRGCFQRNPADRPTAVMLLEHPFLRNSHGQNISVGMQEFSAMKLNDTAQSPRDWTKHKDLLPLIPGTWSKHGKLPYGESSQSYPDSSDSGTAARRSPRSTLEILPTVSSPELNYSLRSVSPSNIFGSLHLEAGNKHSSVFWRTLGREIPHL
ncbi:hypothetical protein RJ640_020315 [Escallonia rubra]|uniref:Protein kinase domain-containing protein n=1 Tax=Escallonia rubra TaxID=112253 RepID=A0AA88RVK0_9ASTE|nr:hypothetical protein RJ640_020315 [Escallonia rubra]